MNNNLKRYFKTGEFAKLCHIKKQTLFHYDDIGLLSPEIKTEKGYRYYSYNQFELFYIISLFRELGIPLKDIKTLIKDKPPIHILDALKNKASEIENKIKHLEHLHKIVNNKILLAEQAFHTDFSAITFQYLEEEQFLISQNTLGLSERKYISTFSDFIQRIQLHQVDSGFPLGGILPREQILNKEFYNYSHLYIKANQSTNNFDIHVRPQGLYIIGYQKGDTAEETYEKLLQTIKDTGLKVGDFSYEEYLFDGVFVDEGQITKIQLHVLV